MFYIFFLLHVFLLLKINSGYVICPYCDPNHVAYPNLEETCRGYDVPMGNPNPGKVYSASLNKCSPITQQVLQVRNCFLFEISKYLNQYSCFCKSKLHPKISDFSITVTSQLLTFRTRQIRPWSSQSDFSPDVEKSGRILRHRSKVHHRKCTNQGKQIFNFEIFQLIV